MPNSLLLFVQKDCEAQHAALWTQRLQAAHCGIASNGGTNQTFCNSHEPLLHQDPQLIQDVTEHCREDLQFGPVSMQDNRGEQLIDAHTHGLLLKLSLQNFSFQRYISSGTFLVVVVDIIYFVWCMIQFVQALLSRRSWLTVKSHLQECRGNNFYFYF